VAAAAWATSAGDSRPQVGLIEREAAAGDVRYVDAARFTAAWVIASPSTWTAWPPCTQMQRVVEGDQDGSG